jgi:hypothetical protein
VVAALAAGGFWYARNLAQTGNPLPWLHPKIGPLSLPHAPSPQTSADSSSIVHYLTDTHLWRTSFLPQLHRYMGFEWPALLLAVAAGAIVAVGLARWRPMRLLGVVVIGAALAYAITPSSAGGPPGFPVLFGLNLRFATPALALGLAILPTLPPFTSSARARALTLVALLALLAATQAAEGYEPDFAAGWGLLLTAGIAAVAAASLAASRSARPRAGLLAVAIATAAALAVAGWPTQRHYFRDRYAHLGPTLPAPSIWAARHVRDARIGIVGYLLQYPLYGTDDSNRVDYVGRRGRHGAFGRFKTCRAWREAVNRGHYRYLFLSPEFPVAFGPTGPIRQPPEEIWTRSSPAAVELLHVAPIYTTVFRVSGPLDPARCGSLPRHA